MFLSRVIAVCDSKLHQINRQNDIEALFATYSNMNLFWCGADVFQDLMMIMYYYSELYCYQSPYIILHDWNHSAYFKNVSYSVKKENTENVVATIA